MKKMSLILCVAILLLAFLPSISDAAPSRIWVTTTKYYYDANTSDFDRYINYSKIEGEYVYSGRLSLDNYRTVRYREYIVYYSGWLYLNTDITPSNIGIIENLE